MGTLKDADTARLPDLSATLQRRFTTAHLGVPTSERAHPQRADPEIPIGMFDALCGVVGIGAPQDRAGGQLRDAVTVGTHSMSEVLECPRAGMTLDVSLYALVGGHPTYLTRTDLKRLAEHAG